MKDQTNNMVSSQTRAKRREILPESPLLGAVNESDPNPPIQNQNQADTCTPESSKKGGYRNIHLSVYPLFYLKCAMELNVDYAIMKVNNNKFTNAITL